MHSTMHLTASQRYQSYDSLLFLLLGHLHRSFASSVGIE